MVGVERPVPGHRMRTSFAKILARVLDSTLPPRSRPSSSVPLMPRLFDDWIAEVLQVCRWSNELKSKV